MNYLLEEKEMLCLNVVTAMLQYLIAEKKFVFSPLSHYFIILNTIYRVG